MTACGWLRVCHWLRVSRGADATPSGPDLHAATGGVRRRDHRAQRDLVRAGLGCMGMSGVYGPADEAESIATIHAALDAGITLLDTGDFYGMGHNEMLIGRALRRPRPRLRYRLSVKFGAQRGPDGSWLGYDARPAAVKTAPGLLAAAPGHRPHRHLPAGAARPQGPDRGDRGRDRRDGRGRLRAARRAVRGRRRHDPPRRRRAPRSPTCRSSTRCSRAASRTRSCRPAASWASGSPPTGCSRAGCSASRSRPTRVAQPGDIRAPHAPLQRREPRPQPAPSSTRCATVADAQGRHRAPAGHRLGRLPRRGHRAADRRPPARPADRGARRAWTLKLDATTELARDRGRPCRPARPPASRYAEAQMAHLDSER